MFLESQSLLGTVMETRVSILSGDEIMFCTSTATCCPGYSQLNLEAEDHLVASLPLAGAQLERLVKEHLRAATVGSGITGVCLY